MINDDLTNSWNRHRSNIVRAVKETGDWSYQDIKDSLSVPYGSPHRDRRGRYARGRGVDPASSNPGQPPRLRTGTLEESVSQPQMEETNFSAAFTITIDAPYGRFLDEGTTKMAERPFSAPAASRAFDYLRTKLGQI